MTTTTTVPVTMTRGQLIAHKIRANVDAYFKDVITYEQFHARQAVLWSYTRKNAALNKDVMSAL